MDTLITGLAIMLFCPAMILTCRLFGNIARLWSRKLPGSTGDADATAGQPEYN